MMAFAAATARGLKISSATGYERYDFAPMIKRVHTAAAELGIPVDAVEDALLERYKAIIRQDTHERFGGKSSNGE